MFSSPQSLYRGNLFNIPDALLTVGSITFLVACALGVFLISDIITGVVVSVAIVLTIISFLALWITMLLANLKKQKDHFDAAMQNLESISCVDTASGIYTNSTFGQSLHSDIPN